VVLLVSYLFSTRYPTPYVIPLSGTELLDHLTLQAGKSIYWTVPVEFKYYLVLPFVAAGFSLLLRRRVSWACVSFSVYLWHLPILVLVGNHLRADPALVALAVIALALLFSGISYLMIERPFIRTRLARRLIALPASWGQPQ